MDEPVDFDFFDDRPKSRRNYVSNDVEKTTAVFEKHSSSSDTESNSTHPSDLHGMHDNSSNSEDNTNVGYSSKSSRISSDSSMTDKKQISVESDSDSNSSSKSSCTELSLTLTSNSLTDESSSDVEHNAPSCSTNKSYSKETSSEVSQKEEKLLGVKNVLHSDSSESMTDVSPLTSPEKSPDINLQNGVEKDQPKPVPYQHITKLNVVFKSDKNSTTTGDVKEASTKRKSYNAVEWSSDSDDDEDFMNSINFEQYRDIKPMEKNTESHVRRHQNAALQHRQRLLDSAARGSMDISNLLETVLEFEKQANTRKARNRMEMPINYRIGENLIRGQERRRKKNMSFSNEQVRDIDLENKRLMQKISNQSRPSSASSIRSYASSRASTCSRQSRSSRAGSSARRQESEKPVRLYHSAVNRLQFQRQIERENMQLLKRLQTAKPTPGLQRRRQLEHYKQQSDYMGTTINRNGMSIQRANELTRNAEVVQKTIGITKTNKVRPAWQDSW